MVFCVDCYTHYCTVTKTAGFLFNLPDGDVGLGDIGDGVEVGS